MMRWVVNFSERIEVRFYLLPCGLYPTPSSPLYQHPFDSSLIYAVYQSGQNVTVCLIFAITSISSNEYFVLDGNDRQCWRVCWIDVWLLHAYRNTKTDGCFQRYLIFFVNLMALILLWSKISCTCSI